MGKTVQELVNNMSEKLESVIEEYEALINKLSQYNNLSFSEKLNLIKECRSKNWNMRDKELIKILVMENIQSPILKESLVDHFVDFITFRYKNMEMKIPLYRSNVIKVINKEIIRKPEKDTRIYKEDLYLSYFEYEKKKDVTSFMKYLKIRYPYVRKNLRPIYHILNKNKKVDYHKLYEEEKKRQEESYKKQLKEYQEREAIKQKFLNSIEGDLEYFRNNGWEVMIRDFEV